MEHAAPTLWLQPAGTPAAAHGDGGCGQCLTADAPPPCHAPLVGRHCDQPRLHGKPALLAQVMEALNRQVVEPGAGLGIVDLHWVQSLHISDDEAELTLAFTATCGPGKALSEAAFQVLRERLPDTDVYVLHTA